VDQAGHTYGIHKEQWHWWMLAYRIDEQDEKDASQVQYRDIPAKFVPGLLGGSVTVMFTETSNITKIQVVYAYRYGRQTKRKETKLLIVRNACPSFRQLKTSKGLIFGCVGHYFESGCV